ncbi:MAG: VacJ family lipoprotein [Steroidobacterales bacterium]
MRIPARRLLILCCVTWLCACVTLPPNAPRSPKDPYERWNRGVYKFNDALDRAVAKPVAITYRRVVPVTARTGISNFLANLNTPTVMVNDLLQGKPIAALNDLTRLLLNTTMGLGGLLDPASKVGLPRNDEDFGQTLGKWGVHAGPFLELPLLGPSDMRDAPARVVDIYTYPPTYLKNSYQSYGLYALYLIDRRTSLLSLDDTLKRTFDPYVFIRDAYLQHRAYVISDGKIPDEEPLVDPDADMPQAPQAPPP